MASAVSKASLSGMSCSRARARENLQVITEHTDRGLIEALRLESNGSFLHFRNERANHVGMLYFFLCHLLPEVTVIRKPLREDPVDPADHHFILGQQFDRFQRFLRHVWSPARPRTFCPTGPFPVSPLDAECPWPASSSTRPDPQRLGPHCQGRQYTNPSAHLFNRWDPPLLELAVTSLAASGCPMTHTTIGFP